MDEQLPSPREYSDDELVDGLLALCEAGVVSDVEEERLVLELEAHRRRGRALSSHQRDKGFAILERAAVLAHLRQGRSAP